MGGHLLYVHPGEKRDSKDAKRKRRSSKTKKAMVKTSTEDNTRHNSTDLNNAQHREQDRDRQEVLVCKLEQTTGPTGDCRVKKRLLFLS